MGIGGEVSQGVLSYEEMESISLPNDTRIVILNLCKWLANSSLWTKSSPTSVFVNYILLEDGHGHSLSVAAFALKLQSQVIVADCMTHKALKYLLSGSLEKKFALIQINHNFSSHSSFDEYVSCFPFSNIMNNSVINIVVHTHNFVEVSVSVGWIPESGLAGLSDFCVQWNLLISNISIGGYFKEVWLFPRNSDSFLLFSTCQVPDTVLGVLHIFSHLIFPISQKLVLITAFYMMNLRFSEVKWLVQNNRAGAWESQDLNPFL